MFESHVNKAIKCGFSNLERIYKSKGLLNSSIRQTLCQSLVLSYLIHSGVVYGPLLSLHFVLYLGCSMYISRRHLHMHWLLLVRQNILLLIHVGFTKLYCIKHPHHTYWYIIKFVLASST